MKLRNILLVFACIAIVAVIKSVPHSSESANGSTNVAQQESLSSASEETTSSGIDDAAAAFQNQQSNVQMTVSGRVINLLPDDNNGSRHQRFIIELGTGQTLLIAHNIDLAGYVDGLREGSQVTVSGEYEWNKRGGVIHWTHHDPQGSHPGGWIQFEGNRYE